MLIYAFTELKNAPQKGPWHARLRATMLCLMFLLGFLLQSRAQDNFGELTQKVSFIATAADAAMLMESLQTQTDYVFSFEKPVMSAVKLSNIRFENKPLREVLRFLQDKHQLSFLVAGKNIAVKKGIVLKKENKSEQEGPGEITGRVKDEQTGEGIPGAVIVVGGKTAVADSSGVFTILLPEGNNAVLISSVGYITQTIPSATLNGTVSIVLKRDAAQLDNVIVTALGIRREEKSLGYAATTLSEKTVKDARTTNWANSLTGKVAGLNIMGAGAGPMGSARITLRGESSLTLDNNQALIVIDGVPISSKITGTGFTSHLSNDNPVDYGSNVSDINPDDIEKISVLKGPGATALYGSRAAGGAIIITTKSGSKNKGLGITYNVNASIEDVNRWPDYQYEYGEGRVDTYYSYGDSPDGANTSTSAGGGRSWGPKYNGQMYFQYNPNSPDGKPTERTPWVPYEDSRKGYFQTGHTVTNNISIEGGGDKGNARLSITHLKNEWIIPNTGYERINAALSVNQKITDKLKISGKINYAHKESDNLPAAGYNNQTLMYFLIIGTTTNVKPEWHKPYWMPGQEQLVQRRPFYAGPDNPWLIMYEMLNKMKKNSVTGNISATYEFTPNLELMVRSGVDMGAEFRSQQRPFSMTKYPRGMFRTQDVVSYEVNTDALLTYRSQLSPAFKYTVSAGANAMRQSYDLAAINADQLSQPGVYQSSNSLDPAVGDPQRSKKAINSVYGLGQLSYEEKIFLDITGRNDWSSALPYKNNSFFYPSVSTSFVLDQLIHLPAAISFAKLRLSWAQVGNDTRPYQTSKYYDGIYGNSFTNPTTLFNGDLKPEITSSFEAGVDVRFFKNRLGIDVAAYTNNSRNQIIAIPMDQTSGYYNKMVNAGLINSRGVEVKITGKPIEGRNFSWTSTLTWSMNRSYVKELADGITSQVIFAHGTDVTVEARVGGRMGDLYGKGFQRSPEGKIIYTSTGVPAPLDPVARKWGNAFADWKAGLLNEFSFKNVRISLLLDGQKGGNLFSQTNHKNSEFGNTKNTLYGRDGGIVGDGVVLGADNKYTPNTVKVAARAYYENVYARSNAEMNIFDASFLKIRELRFEYSLPQSWMNKIHFKQTLIALYGRELFNFTNFPGFDPEGGNLNSGTLTPGVELAQFPSARSIGVNLTFKL